MKLLSEIRNCQLCHDVLPCGPRPIVQLKPSSKILIIGQAPGIHAHESGLPWNDESGKRLRHWLGISSDDFYDADRFAIMPMGFCYPGKGMFGDLPPRKECRVLWHDSVFHELKHLRAVLLIGKYAINSYLGNKTLDEALRINDPFFITLPHPSPLNNIWLSKNSWFESDIVPKIQRRVKRALASD